MSVRRGFEVKQCSESSQRFYFSSSELEKGSSVVRDFILIVLK